MIENSKWSSEGHVLGLEGIGFIDFLKSGQRKYLGMEEKK